MGLPILPAAAVVAALAAGLVATLTIWVPNLYESRAAARSALNTALEANVTLIDDAKRAKAETERNRQISATALRQVQAIDEKMGRLKERVLRGDACLISPDDARALDELFQ